MQKYFLLLQTLHHHPNSWASHRQASSLARGSSWPAPPARATPCPGWRGWGTELPSERRATSRRPWLAAMGAGSSRQWPSTTLPAKSGRHSLSRSPQGTTVLHIHAGRHSILEIARNILFLQRSETFLVRTEMIVPRCFTQDSLHKVDKPPKSKDPKFGLRYQPTA